MHKLILSLILVFSLPAFGQEEEVDYLALAQMLVRDGYYQRAEKSLKKIKDLDKDQQAIVASLWGMIELNRKQYQKALAKFDQSLKLGVEASEIYLYRAESLLNLNRYNEALQSLEKLSDDDKKKLPFFLVKTEIFWRQGQKTKAFEVLEQAEKLNLSASVLLKKKFYFFLQEGLYQAANDLAHQASLNPNSFNDVLAMASQFRIKKQYQLSLGILQSLQMQRPAKEMVALEMAQNYLAMGENFSAALVLEKAAKHNSSLAFEASELLRQIGKSYRARFLNLSTVDQSKKLKQQLALFLEEDDYHSLKFMVPQLRKAQLLEDQDIRYAVAYSLFKTGDFKKSENLLDSIDKEGLFEKSIELKREITNCQKQKWACSETI